MLFYIQFISMASGLDESQSFDALEIILVGFLLVFCMLTFFYFTTLIFGKFFVFVENRSSSLAEVSTKTSPADESSLSPVTDNLDIEEGHPHYIAVIAAAIHCAMEGRKHRIVSISTDNSTWAMEGRRQVLSAHTMRR